MIIRIIFVFLFGSASLGIKAQSSIYDIVQLGDYQVGFFDTVIFDKNYEYEAYDYQGAKPYFLQIWFPISADSVSLDYLLINDLYIRTKDANLIKIQNELAGRHKEIIIRDFISESLLTNDSMDYGNYSYNDIFHYLGEVETRSIRYSIIDTFQFPVIVYHHGAQSCSYENFILSEYLASKGYVVIAANFHLPYENTVFGIKPYGKLIANEDEESLRFISRYASAISKSPSIFFIGHSWGAQMGLRTFNQDSIIKGMISLETTIEFKNDTNIIREMWPEVYRKIAIEKELYPFPILFCAATGKSEPFEFFKNMNAQDISFAPTKTQFEHNAYTSLFYLRYYLDNDFPQVERLILKDRLKYYHEHLIYFSEFLDSVISNNINTVSDGIETRLLELSK